MFKFLDRDEALKVINSWIREGSNLHEFYSHPYGEVVILKGSDGALESFYIFYSKEDYDMKTNLVPWDATNQEIKR